MIIFKYINPTGMFSWGRSNSISLENQGMVNLIGINMDTGGSSNGSGKSSLFNALCEILFGENPTEVSKDGVINTVMGSGFAGRVEFSAWEGILYRVTYCRSWKEDFYPIDNNTETRYTGTKLYFDKWNGEQWIDLQTDKMINTRKIIAEALGLTYGRFLSIAYMSPRVASKFLRGSNAERIDIMAGVTGVEEWDVIYRRAKDRRLDLQNSISDIQTRIAYSEGALNQVQAQLEYAQSTDWVAQLAHHDAELNTLGVHRTTVLETLENADVIIEDLKVQQATAYESSGSGEISQEISDLSVQESQLRNPNFMDESLPVFDPSVSLALSEAQRSQQLAQGEFNALSGGSAIQHMDTCTLCGQSITADHKLKIAAELELRRQSVEQATAFLQQVKLASDAETERIRQARQDKYAERLKLADEVAVKLAECRATLQHSKLEYERVTGLLSQQTTDRMTYANELARCDQQISYHAQQVQVVHQKMGEAAAIQKSVDKYIADLVELRKSIEVDVQDLSVLEWLIRNIPYIKLHRISVALVHLSEKVNTYLSEMGETIRVNLTSFDEKKNTKGARDLKDTLKSEIKVEVVDGAKNIDPRLYSDGETAKISNALIRGLHDISLQSGYGCNVLLLDEIFSYVDPENAQKVADSFQMLNTGSTFVTDNSGHVNDLVRFNTQWVIRKQNGMSVLEV